MNSDSTSEGEITGFHSEKAVTAQPPTQHTSINRRLRDAFNQSTEAFPRSPSPTGGTRPRRSSPTHLANRALRGEKRSRPEDDDYGLTREDRTGTPYDRKRGRYRDMDHNNSHATHIRYDDHDSRDRSGSQQTHPGRLDRFTERYNRRPTEYFVKAGVPRDTHSRGNYHENSKQRGLDQQSVADEGHVPHPYAPYASRSAETRAKPSQQHNSSINASLAAPASVKKSAVKTHEGAVEDVSQPKEALTAEERRRRREAIKAKYKDPSLLVQVLGKGTVPTSPASPVDTSQVPSSRSVSPPTHSPPAVQRDSSVDSPPSINVTNDEELANRNLHMPEAPVTDEPLAADYDPMMDLQEDRARIEKVMHKASLPVRSYDKMQVDQENKVLLPESEATLDESTSPTKPKASDDMFASDDEDDMFAPETSNGFPTINGAQNVAVNIPKAKTLDESMLDNWDDSQGYYKVILGELLESRYVVQGTLGKGVFSGVVKAQDTKTNEFVAIKIIRRNESMTKAAHKEMDILQKLREKDPDNKMHIVSLIRHFVHKGHLCIVFEGLSLNLREVLIKFGPRVGLNLKAVRSYAQQIFLALTLLRKCNIIHADLKPDNILVNETRNMLKICDLGSAADISERGITPYLASRFYRAPEIILGIPYDFAIDMWSIGCTLYELYTGKILFPGSSNNQMLRCMMETRGKFSSKMLKKADFGAVHFDNQNLSFRSYEHDKITRREIVRLINFAKPTQDLKEKLMVAAGVVPGGPRLPEDELKEINLFADLLDKCLALNPDKRITPMDALKHPFIHRAGSNVPGGKA